ncbi:DUF3710 domain-containing protein [Streptomyces sp. NPDC001890]|uniref:caspase, EACC1-associated type n=1 Tax=Streptomyces sp. NPDC001890 TaxID=3364620 RepID=UPI00367929D7
MSVLPDPGASRAVLVGTSRYQHLEQLPAVSNNLQALAGLLSGPLSLQLPAQHVAVVENPDAAHTVVSEVRQAAAEATDTLVIYFAGHGLIDPQDTLSLALPHTVVGRIETGLPYEWLRQVLLLDSRAERHVVILDCCYSGLALGRMSASPGLADQAAVEGSFLLAAAAETRTALAPVGDTYTAFTGTLLDTLRHGIPGGPALLDLGTIYRHLRLTLEARGHPVPQARDRNSGARVALGRNQWQQLREAALAGGADEDGEERWTHASRALRNNSHTREHPADDRPPAPAPSGTGPRPAPFSRSEGPWDRSEVAHPEHGRLNLGGLFIRQVEDMELRVELAGETIVAVTVITGDQAVQLQAFAAPETEGIWDTVRKEIIDGIISAGGTADEATGPLGRELHARVPVELPDDANGFQAIRFVGVDGPGWFLRGVISGRGAADLQAATELEALFRSTVVVRGQRPMKPRDPITLTLSDDAEVVDERRTKTRVQGPDTLATRHSLAHWRGEAGDAAGAVAAFEELLADRLRMLGPDHPYTLATRSNLAYWRGEAGDAAGAVAAFEELLADRLRMLGPNHLSTLATRHSLAHWRGEAGEAAGAAAAFEELLADRLRVLRRDHPDTLATRSNLAYWRGEAGEAAGAAAAFEELLADRLRVLGPNHPDTLATRHSLAHWRGKTGDAAGAAAALEELLADRLRVLGPDHPYTLTTRTDLAYWRWLAQDGRY